MNWRVFTAYSVTIILWGSAFPGIKLGLESFSAEHLSALRLFIGAFALIIFAIIKKIQFPDIRDVPVIFLLGFLGFTVYHTALSFGENDVTAGAASLLVTMTPIFSAILATVFLKEKYSKIGWLGSIIALLGVAMISFGMEGPISVLAVGALLILIAALGESFYFVFQTKYLEKYGFLPFTVYTIVAGSLFMVFFLPGTVAEISDASVSDISAIVYLGLFPTVIPYFALAYVTSKVGASEATSSLYLTPVVALLISWLILSEIPTLLALVGGALTLIGVSLSSLKIGSDDSIRVNKKLRNLKEQNQGEKV
ncbi:DMT family transporter [Halalkalibacter urbisdiaboli]|uniref:DMT family transporter n=1 Tax=Halalkalibacter urbisdiaboli TaxID=1960589 RepID=UPI000B43B3A1|nr:EamA family transporter [Halalkalibacter urbisdiaboli]